MMREGESGKGISSRWYPATLAKRIRDIDSIRNRLTFQHEDAFDVINSFQGRKDVVFFVDPPYTIAGKRLYDYSMVDHKRLFDTMASVQGDFLMTYDDTAEVRDWATAIGFEVENVSMKSRQNSKKSELIIGRNLEWAREES